MCTVNITIKHSYISVISFNALSPGLCTYASVIHIVKLNMDRAYLAFFSFPLLPLSGLTGPQTVRGRERKREREREREGELGRRGRERQERQHCCAPERKEIKNESSGFLSLSLSLSLSLWCFLGVSQRGTPTSIRSPGI